MLRFVETLNVFRSMRGVVQPGYKHSIKGKGMPVRPHNSMPH